MLRIRDVYPGSRILIFTHPGSRIQKQQERRGVRNFFFCTFLCSHKFHKIENYFSFEVLKKEIWANFQRIIELFTQKIVTKPLKNMCVGSGIRKKPIPDPGSRGQKGTGSRIRIRNTSLSAPDVMDTHRFGPEMQGPRTIIFSLSTHCHFIIWREWLGKPARVGEKG